MTQEFHCLPLAGGLFDQPAGYMTRIETVLRAQMEHQEDEEKNEKSREEAKKRVEERLKG